jgi:uncharacterized OB-fold protein
VTTERLLPVPDEASAPFWAAAAEHILTLARCTSCGSLTLPPDVVCPACGTTEPAFEFVPVDGRGTVASWTIVRQAFLPGFDDDLPFALVDVQLTDQPHVRLIGRLLDGIDAPLHLHAAVEVAFEDLTPGVAIPAFRLAP